MLAIAKNTQDYTFEKGKKSLQFVHSGKIYNCEICLLHTVYNYTFWRVQNVQEYNLYSTTKQIVNLYKYEKKKAGYERMPQLPRNLPPDISYLYDAKHGQKSIFSLSTIISSVKLFWYRDSLPNHANAFLWLKI